MVAYGAVLGHCFPVWLRFKGGKAVATGFGVVLGFDPLLGGYAVWSGWSWRCYFGIRRWPPSSPSPPRRSSPIVCHLAAAIGLISGLLLIRHHANIKRLLTGRKAINVSKSRDGGR